MSFDYFYGQQSDLFTFYRVPKVLFTNERFWNISADAKMLYGILLDRMNLSAKNGWIDKNGRVYIIFTIDEAKMALNCAEQKAIKLLSELEKKAGLIERKRQGLGKPNLIYVKNFISAVDSQLLNCENHNSGTMEITTQELPKSQCNNTDIKNTEFSDTDSIFPSGNGGMMDENDRYQEYFDYFSDQLSIDLLKKDYPYDSEMLDNILELIVETVCTKRPLIRIGAEERPAEIVRSRFMKLNAEHIRYVMDCFKENTTKIRNIRQYGNTSTVYYEYRILNVTLTNYGLGNVIASSRLTAEQWERYKVLLETLGNRSYLFGEDVSSAPGGGGEYTDYDIPGEALTDTAFANMVREAEKYLGYPYVWGGSSPSTSFDCSGFVSWVINNCGNGWSVGRQTANGLKNLCDIIPPSEAKPGDLIFFQGTYNTSGASHVGIYVGNGMMIHCGDPISYASIETNYWQQHFYCFGRIP